MPDPLTIQVPSKCIRELWGREKLSGKAPWLVWLSGLSVGLQTKPLPVQIPVRDSGQVSSHVPGGGRRRGNHTLMFLSLSFSLPSSLSKNKWNLFKKKSGKPGVPALEEDSCSPHPSMFFMGSSGSHHIGDTDDHIPQEGGRKGNRRQPSRAGTLREAKERKERFLLSPHLKKTTKEQCNSTRASQSRGESGDMRRQDKRYTRAERFWWTSYYSPFSFAECFLIHYCRS